MMRVSLVYLLLLFALVVEVNCRETNCAPSAYITTQTDCEANCKN